MSGFRRLLGRKPFDGITMDDLARASGLSVGTLYNHFGSKDGVVMAYCADRMKEAFASARSVVADPPPSTAEALFSLLDIYMRGFGGMDRGMLNYLGRILVESRLSGGGKPGFQEQGIQQLRSLLARLREMGLLSGEASEEAVSFLLFGLFSDLLFQYSLCPSVTLEEQRWKLEQFVNLVNTGLARRDDPGAESTGGDDAASRRLRRSK
jgi:AcrR family transcriptional regulator